MFGGLRYRLKRKKYGMHFGSDDIVIGDITLSSVHVLPENEWQTGQEADFYMDDGADIYILRLINSPDRRITLADGRLRYIIIRTPIKDISNQISEIIGILRDIPYNRKLTAEEETQDFPQ